MFQPIQERLGFRLDQITFGAPQPVQQMEISSWRYLTVLTGFSSRQIQAAFGRYLTLQTNLGSPWLLRLTAHT